MIKGRDKAAFEDDDMGDGGSKDRWFTKVNYAEANIPTYSPRPKGGSIRIEFRGYPNLQDMAMQIKESKNGHIFKHTGDVHRTAHNIGMYILRQCTVNAEGNKIIPSLSPNNSLIMKCRWRDMAREHYERLLENYLKKNVSEEELDHETAQMIDSIEDPAERAWFTEYVNGIDNDDITILRNKLKNRERVAKHRAKKRGIEVVD